MAKKDFTASENIDRDKKAANDWDSHHDTNRRYPEEAKGIGEADAAEVKNAHASGDGSFGRNESSVPGEEENEERGDSVY